MALVEYDLGNGRKVYRFPKEKAVKARSHLPCPHIRSDRIDPCVSMADGKTYDSLSALRRTYRADGNPQGQEYIELGNERIPPREVAEPTDAQLLDMWDRAEAQIARGEVPALSTGQ